jgi:glutamate-ammonia-ligase adenylyltransferase
MDAAFASVAFAEPERAETNLLLLERRLPAAPWTALPTLLAQVPDPDEALNYLERYLRDASPRVMSALERSPAALHYLLVLFSHSRFLSETLVQQPELILWLRRSSSRPGAPLDPRLERIKSPEDLHEEFARFEATSFDQSPAVALARFKRREYLRITLRDVLNLATLAETALELSHLADVLLGRALRIAEQKLEKDYGAPQFTDAAGRVHSVRMTILSLGKLGGQELNYSSDIDLMFVYGEEGETAGGAAGSVTNAEFFTRLAHAVLKTITQPTAEGAVFRVDLRLRPEGAQGNLALSLPAMLRYYQQRAREWELQMLIKARASAGDLETGRQFLRQARPLIYRAEFHLGAVEAVLNAREEITRQLRRRAGKAAGRAVEWNVKLSPGGIRDIEFLSQCLQRLYGGAEPWLASAAGSTLVALQRLHDKGHLSGRDFFRLGSAYQFLRYVEHRLQLRDGLQVHTLPQDPDALERLARRCGLESSAGRSAREQFLHRIAQHFAEVREIYERILYPKLRREEGRAMPSPTAESEAAIIAPLGRRLREEYPALVQAVAESGWMASPHARRGLQQFLSSAALESELMSQLVAHPGWIAQAGEACARSDLVAAMLARHPDEVELVAQLAPAELPRFGVDPSWTAAETMSALRIAYRRGTLGHVVRALRGAAQPFDTFAALTELTEHALRAALEVAARETLGPAALETAPFSVIALGRLGTAEMDVASDVDLVFVADESLSSDEREPWRRLAERFVHLASSHTREGMLFPVDTRLRPRGTEGEIVQSAAYVRDYFRAEAHGWEAATFLKARPIGANAQLGARTIAQVREILLARFHKAEGINELRRQLLHTRTLLEKEGKKGRAKGDLKTVPGGYYDIDYLLAFLSLTRAAPTAPTHILRQIAALESSGALDPQRAQTLRSAALLYRSLDHAVRLVTGRPARRLPEPSLLERVAPLLLNWQIPQAANLLPAVEEARLQVRLPYAQTFGAREND